ncbi:MAG: hypothetical protein ABSD75_24150 [Terriglobales bacterium]
MSKSMRLLAAGGVVPGDCWGRVKPLREAIRWWKIGPVLHPGFLPVAWLGSGSVAAFAPGHGAEAGEDTGRPWLTVLSYALAAIFCRAGGWISELVRLGSLILPVREMRPKVVRLGLQLSAGLTLLRATGFLRNWTAHALR